MAVKFVKPTIEAVRIIADDMRKADAAEVWASHRHTPMEAMMLGHEISDFSAVAESEDGSPLVMFGLIKGSPITGIGTIWMLGTENSLNYRREFLLQTPAVIDEMLTICSNLSNYVHSDNYESVRWLKWLGFTVGPETPRGVGGEMFSNFYIERVE